MASGDLIPVGGSGGGLKDPDGNPIVGSFKPSVLYSSMQRLIDGNIAGLKFIISHKGCTYVFGKYIFRKYDENDDFVWERPNPMGDYNHNPECYDFNEECELIVIGTHSNNSIHILDLEANEVGMYDTGDFIYCVAIDRYGYSYAGSRNMTVYKCDQSGNFASSMRLQTNSYRISSICYDKYDDVLLVSPNGGTNASRYSKDGDFLTALPHTNLYNIYANDTMIIGVDNSYIRYITRIDYTNIVNDGNVLNFPKDGGLSYAYGCIFFSPYGQNKIQTYSITNTFGEKDDHTLSYNIDDLTIHKGKVYYIADHKIFSIDIGLELETYKGAVE